VITGICTKYYCFLKHEYGVINNVRAKRWAFCGPPCIGARRLTFGTYYTVSQKNAPTLANCCFDKHGLILIIFDKQHQHTFENDIRVQLSLSLQFYLLYLLLYSYDGNDAF